MDETVTTIDMKVPIPSAMLKDARIDYKFREALIELMLAFCRNQIEEILSHG